MKSTNIKIIVVAALLLLIIIALGTFGIYPEMTKFANAQSELSETRVELEEAEFKVAELNKLSKDQNSINETKDFVTTLLPENKNTSDFVVKSEALADGLSIIILNLTTGATNNSKKTPVADDKQKESSSEFSITMKENYTTTYEVISKLESFPRFNVLDALYFSGYDMNTGLIDFRALGRIFYGK